MKRFLGAVLATAVASVLSGQVRADEAEAKAVVDKAIKALGGEEKLAKADKATWKSKGTITFNGNDNTFSTQLTADGLNRFRSDFEGEFNGNSVKGLTVLDGDKGWRKFGDNSTDMDADAVANTKRTLYLSVVPATLVALKDKSKGFKIDSAADEKVGDKPAAVVKVTAPDGKTFTISFDKASGLPLKTMAKVAGFQGDEFDQETTYSDYKDFGGIKKAAKVEVKRNGEPFQKLELTEFKTLDKFDADTFAEPK